MVHHLIGATEVEQVSFVGVVADALTRESRHADRRFGEGEGEFQPVCMLSLLNVINLFSIIINKLIKVNYISVKNRSL